jgi:O-antigen ligase
MDAFHDARRDAMIAGGLVALIAALLALWTSGLLIAFGIAAIVIGIVLSITVIGAIIGVPLIVVGVLGLIAGIVSGIGGVPFAVLFGAGTGYVYYRFRMRALVRATQPPARRATY